jgi:hypothetical protein
LAPRRKGGAMSDQPDLSDLDRNVLVARLSVVKVRVLEDSRAAEVEFCSNDAGNAQMAAQRADTEAVLDECASRLLGQEIRGAAERWQSNAEDAMAGAEAALAEAARLRGLIRGVLTVCPPALQCQCCGKLGSGHNAGCPWPALMAEAAKA